jgi:hypothetical protein
VVYDQCGEIIVPKMGVGHGRCQVSMAHRLLDQRDRSTRRQPGRHPAVTQVKLEGIGLELRCCTTAPGYGTC